LWIFFGILLGPVPKIASPVWISPELSNGGLVCDRETDLRPIPQTESMSFESQERLALESAKRRLSSIECLKSRTQDIWELKSDIRISEERNSILKKIEAQLWTKPSSGLLLSERTKAKEYWEHNLAVSREILDKTIRCLGEPCPEKDTLLFFKTRYASLLRERERFLSSLSPESKDLFYQQLSEKQRNP